MINKVILVGNLGKDPEVRRFDNDSMVATFSVATNENYRDKNGEWQKKTEWHNVAAWRYLAERAESSLKKGMLVYIEGKLTTRKYQDKDGNDKYITEVVANVMRILEKRENLGQDGIAPSAAQSTADPTTTGSDTTVETVPESADDDLPF